MTIAQVEALTGEQWMDVYARLETIAYSLGVLERFNAFDMPFLHQSGIFLGESRFFAVQRLVIDRQVSDGVMASCKELFESLG